MKVFLRADSSAKIGTGHVVRQVALGRELARRGVDVVLSGSVSGPEWVAEMLREETGILWSPIDEGTFDSKDLGGAQGAVVVVDSYLFGQLEAGRLVETGARVVQFWDGPWQAMVAPTVIAPVLDFSLAVANAPQRGIFQILGGPEFIMIRPEIREVARRRTTKNIGPTFRIVVLFGGGSDQTHIGWVVNAIRRANLPCEVDVFTTLPSEPNTLASEFGSQVRFHSAGSQILQFLERASLAISAVGTTAMELIFLSIPSIFVPVAANQSENARSISFHNLGKVVNPDDSDRERKMVEDILGYARQFQVAQTSFTGGQSNHPRIDGEGVRRVADVLLSLGSPQ